MVAHAWNVPKQYKRPQQNLGVQRLNDLECVGIQAQLIALSCSKGVQWYGIYDRHDVCDVLDSYQKLRLSVKSLGELLPWEDVYLRSLFRGVVSLRDSHLPTCR